MAAQLDPRRVAEITVQQFRGGSRPVTVRLTGRNDANPQSALIFGENGTGKSTLVDAVEICLQATVGRGGMVGPERPALVSLATDADEASCQVVMADGTVHSQELRWVENKDGVLELVRSRGDRVAGFDFAPISLKRADILRFLETPAVRRGMVFLDYFPTSPQTGQGPKQDAAQIEHQLAQVRHDRREAGRRLGAELGVENPPTDAQQFDDLITKRVYQGIDPAKAQATGLRIRVPKEVEEQLGDYTAIRERERALKRRLRALTAERPNQMVQRFQRASASLDNISSLLTESFAATTNAPHVRSLDVRFGSASDVALEIVVSLDNGRTASLQQVFSEGYQDLVALLFFLAVAREAAQRGQAEVLVLDDVLQSVDAGFRSRLMDHVLTTMGDWQLLITVHDRLWRNQLREQLRRHGHRFVDIELGRWAFTHGVRVTDAASEDTGLRAALATGLPASICAEAGRLLEQMSDRLSQTLGTSVKRRQGDRYTLGDLWPGVLKELKKTTAATQAVEVDRWVSLRNMVGAHYNEWAEGLSTDEAESFGAAVLQLLDRVRCTSCGLWVEPSRRCRCGALTLNP